MLSTRCALSSPCYFGLSRSSFWTLKLRGRRSQIWRHSRLELWLRPERILSVFGDGSFEPVEEDLSCKTLVARAKAWLEELKISRLRPGGRNSGSNTYARLRGTVGTFEHATTPSGRPEPLLRFASSSWEKHNLKTFFLTLKTNHLIDTCLHAR